MNFDSAIKIIRNSSRILLTTHIRPDGDAIGSLVALKDILDASAAKESRNGTTQILLPDPAGPIYQFLLPSGVWYLNSDRTQQQIDANSLDEFDLIIIADTSSKSQLPALYDYLLRRRNNTLVIDHHASGENLGSCRLIDSTAAAAGEIVFRLASHAGWHISPSAANALFASIATDTGWFRFENTSPETLSISSHLVERGAVPNILYEKLYQNDPPQRLRLIAASLHTLELHENNRIAVMRITRKMLADCSADRSLIENIVNLPMQIGSVLASILFVEQDDGKTRASLRSKRDLDVNRIASQFGGGGHARAAGVTLNSPHDPQNLLQQIILLLA